VFNKDSWLFITYEGLIMNKQRDFEHKSYTQDALRAFEDMHRSFDAYRQANDERLAQIEDKKSVDHITLDKIDRIDQSLNEAKRRLDDVMLAQTRPRLASESKQDDYRSREHKTAFHSYMRSGETQGLKAIEEKAMSSTSGPDGGYLVPIPAETEILRRLAIISPIRSIATVQQISTATLRKAFSYAGPAAGWVAEADPRPQTTNQQIADMSFPAMELYAMPAATQTLLDDAVVDIEQWIASEVETVFAEQEGAAFVNGTGVNKPNGFLNYPKVEVSSNKWGSLSYVPTGTDGAFSATSPSDTMFDLIYALRAGYRQNARFVMNRKTQALVRKFKSTTGEYLWEPPTNIGGTATFMNFPLVEAEDMPDVNVGSYAIAFGDFQRGYIVVDRVGIRVLRDPFSAKPYVLFYTTKRVGGGVQDFDAIKLLKFAAS
jgi:HK97 family phage major capsid protein